MPLPVLPEQSMPTTDPTSQPGYIIMALMAVEPPSPSPVVHRRRRVRKDEYVNPCGSPRSREPDQER